MPNTNKSSLSSRAAQTLEYLESLYRQSPGIITKSYREIKDALDISSTSLLQADIEELEAAGHIVKPPHIARAIILINPPALHCPHCGGELDLSEVAA